MSRYNAFFPVGEVDPAFHIESVAIIAHAQQLLLQHLLQFIGSIFFNSLK